jgi:hypothetical protein
MLNEVQTGSIGEGPVQSPYSKLAEVFLAKGADEYFRKMLRCDNVVVRVMAMDCILFKQGAKAIGLLKSRLSSRAAMSYQWGCIGDVTTEGAYAHYKLIYAHVPRKARAPRNTATTQGGIFDSLPDLPSWSDLLSGQEKVALDIEVLSRNDTAAMHADASQHIIGLIDANDSVLTEDITAPTPLELPALRKQTGGQSGAAIIKAIGRLKPRLDVEGFLVKCLNDTGLDAQSRLAAASALTRYSDDQAREAIESNKDSLNKLQADAGTKICNALLIREQYGMDIAPFREDETAAQALLKLSTSLATEIEPWNTYGNIPYLCEFALNAEDLCEAEAKRSGGDPSELTFKRLLSAEEYQRLVRNIEAAIGAESKAATQPAAAK